MKTTSYDFRVPNTYFGRLFLRLAREYNTSGRLRARGRGKNRRANGGTNFCHDMPIANAEWYAVYHDKKKVAR